MKNKTKIPHCRNNSKIQWKNHFPFLSWHFNNKWRD